MGYFVIRKQTKISKIFLKWFVKIKMFKYLLSRFDVYLHYSLICVNHGTIWTVRTIYRFFLGQEIWQYQDRNTREAWKKMEIGINIYLVQCTIILRTVSLISLYFSCFISKFKKKKNLRIEKNTMFIVELIFLWRDLKTKKDHVPKCECG